MNKTKETSAVPAWRRRIWVLLMGAGALAAAVLGVLNLWDRLSEHPGAVATIASVQISKMSSLGEFAAEPRRQNLYLRTTKDSSSWQTGASILVLPINVKTEVTATEGTAREVTDTFGDSLDPEVSAPPTTAPTTVTPSQEQETVTPTLITTSPTTPESTAASIDAYRQFDEDYLQELTKQKALQEYAPNDIKTMLNITSAQAVAPDGTPLPPESVAEALADSFSEVAVRSGPENHEPLGWTLAVRVNTKGLEGVPLLLTWSLDGVDVSEHWTTENLAYRVLSTTQEDAGVAKIWVPKLKHTGNYNVNVALSYESDGVEADYAVLEMPRNEQEN